MHVVPLKRVCMVLSIPTAKYLKGAKYLFIWNTNQQMYFCLWEIQPLWTKGCGSQTALIRSVRPSRLFCLSHPQNLIMPSAPISNICCLLNVTVGASISNPSTTTTVIFYHNCYCYYLPQLLLLLSINGSSLYTRKSDPCHRCAAKGWNILLKDAYRYVVDIGDWTQDLPAWLGTQLHYPVSLLTSSDLSDKHFLLNLELISPHTKFSPLLFVFTFSTILSLSCTS